MPAHGLPTICAMSTPTVRRAAAAGLAVVAILASTGCARHVGAQPVTVPSGQQSTSVPAGSTGMVAGGTGSSPAPATTDPRSAAAAANAALGTAIDQAGAAASSQNSDLSQSTGGAEGDPTQ